MPSTIKPLLWSELTWEQIRDMRAEGLDIVLFPIGSTEQHGPHLPLATDTITAEVVAHAVSARTGVPVLPTLPFGCTSDATRNWPGTLALSPATLIAVVSDILEDAIGYGFTRLLVLNGNISNDAPVRCALESLRVKYPTVQIACKHLSEASPRVRAAYESDVINGHGNAAETALMLCLKPQLVRRDRIFDEETNRSTDLIFSYRTAQMSAAGHTGNPSRANAAMGAELFEALVADWTYMVKRALVEKPPLSNLPQSAETVSSLDSPLKNCGPPGDVIYSSTPSTMPFTDQSVTEKSHDGLEKTDELPPLFRAPTTTMRN